jgi:mannosyltransferase OCH1-like enzyme
MKVHQVYWSFDGKEQPVLFVSCSDKVKNYCKDKGFEYKLWNKEECETLIKEYPKYEEVYNKVKYPVMKIDMIRFLILHKEGGLYLDMDIEPKIDTLKESDLVLSLYHDKGKDMYNVEVIQSSKGNDFCLKYLDYVLTQIEEKDKIDIYKSWKVRYVLQTTGPKSFSRFIKTKKIPHDTYNVNNSTTNPPQFNLEGKEDFISYPSGSWIK